MITLLTFLPSAKQFHMVGRAAGGEYSGPCPRCRSRDRFRLWLQHTSDDAGGRCQCCGCERQGNGLTVLMDYERMPFQATRMQQGGAA